MHKASPFVVDAIWQQRFSDDVSRRQNDQRSPFQRDRARILHSAAFRRLQAKTQVMSVGISDFYRTRLTHSLEAAQIGYGIITHLRAHQPEFVELLPSNSLIEALCLAHDIGHPPFGHGGEIALNYMMRNDGYFEGNAQTFRILTRLEPYTEHHGMNLTRRTLLGVMKYPALLSQVARRVQPPAVESFRRLKANHWYPPKGIYDEDQTWLEWVLRPLGPTDRAMLKQLRPLRDVQQHRKTSFKSLDCSIMELADDIAYGVHDLEDAVVTGVITRHQWDTGVIGPIREIPDCWLSGQILPLSEKLFSPHHYQQKDAIGALVNGFITAIEICPQACGFSEPLLRFNARLSGPMQQALEIFKQLVLQKVVHSPEIELIRYKGQQIVMELFDVFSSDPERLLPEATQARWHSANAAGANPNRVIADYIAGMTDEYANRLYTTLFGPRTYSRMSDH